MGGTKANAYKASNDVSSQFQASSQMSVSNHRASLCKVQLVQPEDAFTQVFVMHSHL